MLVAIHSMDGARVPKMMKWGLIPLNRGLMHPDRFQRRHDAHNPKPPWSISRGDERRGNSEIGFRQARSTEARLVIASERSRPHDLASLGSRDPANRPFHCLAMVDCRA
jgi:hypothetical protein